MSSRATFLLAHYQHRKYKDFLNGRSFQRKPKNRKWFSNQKFWRPHLWKLNNIFIITFPSSPWALNSLLFPIIFHLLWPAFPEFPTTQDLKKNTETLHVGRVDVLTNSWNAAWQAPAPSAHPSLHATMSRLLPFARHPGPWAKRRNDEEWVGWRHPSFWNPKNSNNSRGDVWWLWYCHTVYSMINLILVVW